MESSPRFRCPSCKCYKSEASFHHSARGKRYTTCLECSARNRANRDARRVREPLAEINPNTLRRTRAQTALSDHESPPLIRARRRRTGPQAPAGFLSAFVPQDRHDLGGTDHICDFCGARHWMEEMGQGGQFEGCCKEGDVYLPPIREPPELL